MSWKLFNLYLTWLESNSTFNLKLHFLESLCLFLPLKFFNSLFGEQHRNFKLFRKTFFLTLESFSLPFHLALFTRRKKKWISINTLFITSFNMIINFNNWLRDQVNFIIKFRLTLNRILWWQLFFFDIFDRTITLYVFCLLKRIQLFHCLFEISIVDKIDIQFIVQKGVE